MDWGRAKTVLIVSFFMLNILLGYQLWTNSSDMSDAGEDATSAAEELEQLLQTKKIELSVEIPKQAPRMNEITVTLVRLPQTGKGQEMNPPVAYHALINHEKFKEQLAKSKDIVHGEAYEFDPVQSQNGVIMLYQMYRQFPLFDVYLRLIHENGAITRFQQVYAEEISEEEETEEHKVLSATTVLRTLAENYLVDGTQIVDIRLGYHGQMFDSEKQVLAPYWRVAVSGGELYYVHAINGAVEVPQKRSGTDHEI